MECATVKIKKDKSKSKNHVIGKIAMSKSNVKIVTDEDLRPKITVVGVGGAGGNAVNNMIRAKLEGVEFIVANTDAQSLEQSLVEPKNRLQLGLHITQGLGAGSKPDVGRGAAEESIDDVVKRLEGSNMVFITAGMGGGTGTGAAPVIARAARESGILTVGVVTKPFHFEGTHRMKSAERGIEELHQYVDTLIIIPNQNLFRLANERTTFADAFKMADDVLYSGVRGITDLILMPGLINLDFADIRAVMAEMGKAMMGTGEAEGDRRALDAAEAAISNPLLDDVSMKGAKAVLINITGGYDMTLYEMDEAANRIREDVESEANIIFGSSFDEKLNGRMRVSVVATGIGAATNSSARKTAHAGTVDTPQAQQPLTPSQGYNTAAQGGMSMMNNYGSIASQSAQGNGQTTHAPQGHETYGNHTPSQQGYEGQQASQDTVPQNHPDMSMPTQYQNEHATTTTMLNNNFTQNTHEKDSNHTHATQPTATQKTFNFNDNGYTTQPPVAAEPRKKSLSLFERFTGAHRAKAQAQQAQPKAEHVTKTEQRTTEEESGDFLDIPAFLRRGNS